MPSRRIVNLIDRLPAGALVGVPVRADLLDHLRQVFGAAEVLDVELHAAGAAAALRKPPNGIAAPPVFDARRTGLDLRAGRRRARAGRSAGFATGRGAASAWRSEVGSTISGAFAAGGVSAHFGRSGLRDLLDRPAGHRRHAAGSGPSAPPSEIVIVGRSSARARTPVGRHQPDGGDDERRARRSTAAASG